MDGVLSQEEINALLNPSGGDADGAAEELLTESEKDAIGEIGNISMGTAATTLFSLVNRKVEISTPVVSYGTWDDIVKNYERPCVFIRIAYTVGLNGSNILVLRENDVKVITDLMMGGDGLNTEDTELGELHLSAISEAMNQMMGSSATSLSSMLNKTIDISPPIADLIDLKQNIDEGEIAQFLTGRFVKVSFRMEIGDLVDSEIMQLYPVSFAKEMCEGVSQTMEMGANSITEPKKESAAQAAPASTGNATAPQQAAPQVAAQQMDPQMMNQGMGQPMMGQPMMNQGMGQPMMNQGYAQPMMGQPVNVQPAQFQAFNAGGGMNYQPENIDLIMDVPLEVTVELGRTTKSISDILDFGPGKIIELNKIAGEPIDVLVNGKYVAKGEVVVIEESFGVRITEIISPGRPIV